jgi:phosphoglycerate dehydrogenase-like enzyme
MARLSTDHVVVVLPEVLRPGFHESVLAVSPRIDLALIANDKPLPSEIDRAAVLYRSSALSRDLVDALLERAPGFLWMHIPAAGIDFALSPKVLAGDFLITKITGVYDAPVAEVTLGLIIAAAKRLPTYFAAQREGHWLRAATWDAQQAQRDQPQLLRGKTVGMIGFGASGAALAAALRAIGMRVLGVRRDPKPDPRADAMYPASALGDVLAEADYVVLTLPLTPTTEGIIGAREIARMKPTAWLVNVGRGRLVDDDALIAALESGRIAGACLDVFTREPLPEGHPYYRLPNVIMTPHIAGAFPELNDIDRDYFLDLLRRFLAGEPFPATVDRARGY